MILKKFFALALGLSFLLMSHCSANGIIAATITNESPWFLSLCKTDSNEYAFLVLNYETEQCALFPYNLDNYNFYLKDSPFIFLMAVKDSPKNVDSELGEWRGEFHVIPVYALFNYVNGEVVLESYLSSCQGMSSSHYQARIQSPLHLKLAEIFLTHMPALHKEIESKGIALP